MSENPLSDTWFATFGGAASRAAVFELRARLAADAIPELTGSITKGLGELIDDIADWMERTGVATALEREKLRRCARIRNKLFHAEFSRAAGQLKNLDAELKNDSVRMFKVDGPMTLEKFRDAINQGGTAVGKTRTASGRVYGWLWNLTRAEHLAKRPVFSMRRLKSSSTR